MAPDARAGHHADVVYVHEDGSGSFNAAPSDSTHKIFGGNVTADIDESRDPVKIWNSARTPSEHVSRVFDGGVTIDGDLGPYGPWWLSEVYGTASEAGSVAPSVYHYQLDVGGDPRSMRVISSIAGMSSVHMATGVVPQTVTISENFPENPTFSLDCVFAGTSTLASTISVPSFTYETYNNAEAELKIGGTTLGVLQNTDLTININTDLVGEIGSSVMVDFSPKAFNPELTAQKIVRKSDTTGPGNLVDHFYGGGNSYTHAPSTADIDLIYDNGSTGASTHTQTYTLKSAIPSDLSKSNLNNPDEDLLREVTEMAENLDVKLEIGKTAK